MKIRYFLIFIPLVFILHSCVVLSTKKYKSLVAERDSLATRTGILEDTVAKLKADTVRLDRQIRGLQSEVHDLQNQLAEQKNSNTTLSNKNKELEEKYTAATSNLTTSSSKVNQLLADLKKREQRLNEVEQILRDRDDAANLLKSKLQEALLGFKQNGLSVDIRNGKVYVSLADKLLFPSGSIIIDDRGKQALEQLAIVLNKEPNISIAVEGHTDDKKVINLGQIKDNWDLSVLRATSVCRFLTETENVDPHRLTATGKSAYQPIDTGNTSEARTKNRRIEIILTPKLDELYNLISK